MVGKIRAFITSKKRIINPISKPRTLNVFVAPVAPLPWFLKSTPLKVFPNQTDNGIEPIRYEIKYNNFYPIYKKKLTISNLFYLIFPKC